MDRAEFERLRGGHVDKIREDLQEALQLLCQLNHNLEVWGERTGETEALSQVWMQFQRQLGIVSAAFDATRK